MNSLNAVKSRFNSVSASIAPYSQSIQMALFSLVAIIIVYVVYMVLFPSPDEQMQVIVSGTLDANSLGGTSLAAGLETALNKNIVLKTGGEYSFSTWIYISNFDYRAGQPKHIFHISTSKPESGRAARPGHVAMVGIMYPNENKIAIRVHQDMTTVPGHTATSVADLTLSETLSSVFNGSGAVTASSVFNSSIGYPICDINNVDLQKWICLTVVVNGRVIDVYVDGKLARSCVTLGIPTVEDGTGVVSLGNYGGWGGNISTTTIFGYALTPGKIYEMYQTGPANPGEYGFLGWLYKRLHLDQVQANILYYSNPNNANEFVNGR
jgi:hypothetical protein